MMTRDQRGRGERRIKHNVLFRVVFVILPVIVSAALIRPVLSEYYSKEINDRDVLLASRITKEDARYNYLLGLLAYTANPPLPPFSKGGEGGIKPAVEGAIKSYMDSLRRNPLRSRVWLALARAYRDGGMTRDAGYALRKALYLDRNNPDLIWEAGVFFLLEEKGAEAVRLFGRYIYMVPEEQENVYSLCYAMGVDPEYMLDNLVPAGYPFYGGYLRFLTANKLLIESLDAWKKVRAFKPDRSEYLRYSSFLIENGETEKAQALWDDFMKTFAIGEGREAGEGIWNGDFELPIENGGFDWRIAKSEGVRIFPDKDIRYGGYASLSVNFDGRHNPGICIAHQIVPVGPGKKYKLTGHVKTEKLTTQNGIVLEASGHLCDPFIKKTEPVTGTNLWKRVELEFTTPCACRTIKIGIKRERSEKFDNKINGDAWIDALSLSEIRN